MKCPKCGFNSFEYLSNCKKCGNVLDAFKDSLGLRPLVLAPALGVAAPDVQTSFELMPNQAPSETEATNETFQWDQPDAVTKNKPAESVYEEFDLNLVEAGPAPPSSPFLFDEELPPNPAQALPADDSLFGAFSFEEPAEEPPPEPFLPDAYEQSPQTAAAETTLGEFSFDDLSSELDPFATTLTDTDSQFGESAEAVSETSSDAEFPCDTFGEITTEELRQKSEPMARASGELDLDDFLLMDETTITIQEEEKKTSTTGAQLDHDEPDSPFGAIETPVKN